MAEDLLLFGRKRITAFRGWTTAQKVFIGGVSFLFALTVALAFLDQGQSFFLQLHINANDTFMDFFNSVSETQLKNPYVTHQVIYPPLTYTFYRFFRFFLPVNTGSYEWRSCQSGLVIIFGVSLATYAALKKLLWGLGDSLPRCLPYVLLIASLPFIYAFERGNLIMLTLITLLFFLRFYRSDKPWLRELALISLAVSAGFKIYPACFGILLIRDKRWKDALHCVLYGLASFLLPFAFWGGPKAFMALFHNLLNTSQFMESLGPGFKVNLANTISWVGEIVPLPQLLFPIAAIAFAAILIFLILRSRQQWQVYLALSAIMVLLPGFSYTYTLIFMVIPLIDFLNMQKSSGLMNGIYAWLFVGLFGFFPFGFNSMSILRSRYMYPLSVPTIIESAALIGILLLSFAQTLQQLWSEKHGGSAIQKEASRVLHTHKWCNAVLCLFAAGSVLLCTLTEVHYQRVEWQQNVMTPIEELLIQNPQVQKEELVYLVADSSKIAQELGQTRTMILQKVLTEKTPDSNTIGQFFRLEKRAFLLDSTMESKFIRIYGSRQFSQLVLSRFQSAGSCGNYELFVLKEEALS